MMIEPRLFRTATGVESRHVELTKVSASARFPRGTVIVCAGGHEIAEFGVNVEPNQLISVEDIVSYREGQSFVAHGAPGQKAQPVPRCRCGRRWTRVRGAGGWPEIRTADGWR